MRRRSPATEGEHQQQSRRYPVHCHQYGKRCREHRAQNFHGQQESAPIQNVGKGSSRQGEQK